MFCARDAAATRGYCAPPAINVTLHRVSMDVHAAAPEAAPSFVTLIEPHLDYLYAFARKLCGERMAAEDLVQDTLLRAFRAQDSLRNR
jgi:DNA-directed RNA polymerase specialized sigma24 family protein